MGHAQLDAWVLLEQALRDGRHDAGIHDLGAANRQLARRWIPEEFDLLQSLPHLIEDVDAAFEQGRPVAGDFHPLRASIEQLHSKRMFEIGNSLGHDGM